MAKLSKNEFISKMARKTRKVLLAMCAEEKVRVDDTMSKARVAEILYNGLRDKAKKEREDQELEEARAEAAQADTGPVETAAPTDTPEVLNPMRKPSSYAVLMQNAALFSGILSERYDEVKGVLRVVTGSGQKWEFPRG